MNRHLLSLFLITVFFITQGFLTQSCTRREPREKTKKKEINFFDIQKRFYEYWKDRKIQKRGRGWKQFKRLEHFMESRVNPDGSFPHSILWEESKKRKPFRLSKDISDELPPNWEPLGPVHVPSFGTTTHGRGIGRLNTIAFDPNNPSIIWVGSPSGGLWNSANGGGMWRTTTDHLPNLGVSDIAINPANPNIMYIATGDRDSSIDTYSYGVLKSEDGGINWFPSGLSFVVDQYHQVNRILIHPTNPNILLAATDNGIYRTEDAGTTWTPMNLTAHFKSMEFKPGDPQVVYAGSYGRGYANLYRSLDNGQNWVPVSSNLPSSEVTRIELAVSPAEPGTVYAVCSDLDEGYYGLYKSINSGQTWNLVSNSPNILGREADGSDTGGQADYDLAIAVSPTNTNLVFVGGVNIWKSTDGGLQWDLAGQSENLGENDYLHVDHHVLKFLPGTDILFSGNDGGLYKTDDWGTTWQDLSNDLAVTQFYRMGVSFSNPDLLLAGAQDNGVMLYNTGNWKTLRGGDWMECIIDYYDETVMYASGFNGALHKFTDGGDLFSPLDSLPPWGTGSWITPIVMHPTDNNTLYAGFKDVYKTINGGDDWSPISTNLTPGGNLGNLCVAPSDPNYIYASSGRRQIWRTAHGGTDWTEINSGLPNDAVSGIAISNVNPHKVWVIYLNFSPGEKVYVSDDGGTTWNNYSNGLPNIPINCIVYKNYSNDALFLGSDAGVFYRDADMTEWVDYSTGLPNVIVNDLEIDYVKDRLISATYGRGIWRTPISHAFPQRDPVDIMLVLDLSGSMLSPACPTCEPKLRVLKDAVELFVQLWRVFTAEDDRIGITYFKTTINQFQIGADVLVPVSPNTAAVITDVQAQTTVVTNLTAMGGGIQTAVQQLTDDTRPRNIILFTDGMQNVNPMVDESTLQIVNEPGHAGSGIAPLVPPMTLDNNLNIKVNTIGVGASAPFGALLEDIASHTGGVFKITTAPDEELRRFYVEELVEALKDYSPQLLGYRYGSIDVTTGTAEETFTVNKGAGKILLKLSRKRGDVSEFSVEKDGNDITRYGKWIKGDYYSIFYMSLPHIRGKTIHSEGNWTMRIKGGKGTAYEAAVIIDEPFLDYDFLLDRKEHTTGEPIGLTARLTVEGKPITTGCSVTARVLKPQNGFSTLLSTHADPVVPSKYQFEPGATPGQKKLELLLQDKKFYEQLRPEEETVTLKSNTNGTYSAEFTDTLAAGIYTVIFQATGQHPVIGAYNRTETLSTMVRFGKIDPGKSGLVVGLLDQTGKGRYMQLYIRPVDYSGNYLGPDYGHEIQVLLDGKAVQEEYNDPGDGSYELTFFVPNHTDPEISVLVKNNQVFEGPLSQLE
jgi:photosystem II stability/assembly factor-like uncharacterized protein